MNQHPHQAERLFHEALRRMETGDVSAAESALRAALAHAPAFAEAHANLGLLLHRARRAAEAEQAYLLAATLQPDASRIHLNFGNLLADSGRAAEAEARYRRALDVDPGGADAWSALGALLASSGRTAEAEACLRQALTLEPAHAGAAFNLAYVLLREARYAEGWQRLEARPPMPQPSGLQAERWRGEALAGRSLLICQDGGHGDMLHFVRYAALAKSAGATRVAVLCAPALVALLAHADGVDEAHAFGDVFDPAWDWWVPALSLPGSFGTQAASIPAALPYLAAEAGRMQRWSGLAREAQGRRRVGLVWIGNPRFENDAQRSLPSIMTLAPLADAADACWFSLQKGAGADEAHSMPHGLPLIDLAPGIADFADLAAVMMHLDLVITVDTAAAHLAGALGKPCWVLLPAWKTDWRWLENRSDSPWYPGVLRLFRQTVPGEWAPVIAAVAKALQA
ncbi:tetratricopeptide repeat protein [Oxalobacteraceae bacterium OM1]|nr:tetratricopeptide repeat protein [Oxalobacteraceae bacterium OM1]